MVKTMKLASCKHRQELRSKLSSVLSLDPHLTIHRLCILSNFRIKFCFCVPAPEWVWGLTYSINTVLMYVCMYVCMYVFTYKSGFHFYHLKKITVLDYILYTGIYSENKGKVRFYVKSTNFLPFFNIILLKNSFHLYLMIKQFCFGFILYILAYRLKIKVKYDICLKPTYRCRS